MAQALPLENGDLVYLPRVTGFPSSSSIFAGISRDRRRDLTSSVGQSEKIICAAVSNGREPAVRIE